LIDRRSVMTGLACVPAACAPRRPTLRFSILSTEERTVQAALWRPFLSDMGTALGRLVEPYFADGYGPLVEAMRQGAVSAGWFSNQSGLWALRRGGGRVVARTSHPGGDEGYHAELLVRRDSGLTLDDLLDCGRRLSIRMGDRLSTSGTVVPMAYLFGPHHIDPERCFSRVEHDTSHEANLRAVAEGRVDAAFYNSNDRQRMTRRGGAANLDLLRAVEPVWTSPRLPEDVIMVGGGVDPGLEHALRTFLAAYGDGQGAEAGRQRRVLADLNFGVFRAAGDEALDQAARMEAAARAAGWRPPSDTPPAEGTPGRRIGSARATSPRRSCPTITHTPAAPCRHATGIPACPSPFIGSWRS
jgi:phosphonate transport system substrate-binding protein